MRAFLEKAPKWTIRIACPKRKDLGYATGTWTSSVLIRYVRQLAEEVWYSRLATVSESTVFNITMNSVILILIVKCIMSFWFINSCRSSLMKIDNYFLFLRMNR